MFNRVPNIFKLNWHVTVVLFFLFIAHGIARPFSFSVTDNLKPTRLTSHVEVYQHLENLPADSVLKIMNANNNFEPLSSTSFGFSNEYYWLRTRLINIENHKCENVITVNNPHLDFVKVWEIDETNNIKLIYFGGDGMPFNDRTVINRNIVIPINLKAFEEKDYLIQVDKRGASVSVPLQILSIQEFERMEKESLFAFGMYFGVLTLIVVFSLFVAFIMRQSIFFWYAFYLFFLGFYLLAHVGLLFQFGYPNLNWFNDYSRPLFITLSTTALLHFIRLLLNIQSLLPHWNRYFNIVIYTLLGLTLYWMLTPWWHEVQTIFYLNAQNLTLMLSLLLVLITSILTFKRQKLIVMFFWIAFLAVLSAGMSIILVESGLANESVISINPLFFGSMIEAVVFAIGLSYWSKVNDTERLHLLKVIQTSKKKMVDSYVQGIEKEKEKIASDLHDDIGSRLSHLKRQLSNNDNVPKDIVERIGLLSNEVRRISHELSPPSFKTDEFLISLRHLIYTHQTDQLEINLQLFDLPNSLDKNITKQVYRIVQSALNDIERRANSTNVDVQIFHHNSELVLAIEDNGMGFNYNKKAPEDTTKAMVSRVELINGTIEISSSKRHGTSIMIQIPISSVQ